MGEIYEEAAIAEDGALKEGDVILKVEGKQVNILMMDDLQIAMRRIDHEGTFTVLRNGKLLDVHVRKSNVFVRDTEGKIMYDEEKQAAAALRFWIYIHCGSRKIEFFPRYGQSFFVWVLCCL